MSSSKRCVGPIAVPPPKWHRMVNRLVREMGLAAFALLAAQAAGAQTLERLTFQEAIARAIKSNPTVAQATTGIMRAEAILQQVRSSSLPSLTASLATNFANPVKFDTSTV